MFGNKCKIAMATMLMTLACGQEAMLGAPTAPVLAPSRKPLGKSDDMFPDGREHDFGAVKHGPQVTHAFRIVNTSNAPVSILVRMT